MTTKQKPVIADRLMFYISMLLRIDIQVVVQAAFDCNGVRVDSELVGCCFIIGLDARGECSACRLAGSVLALLYCCLELSKRSPQAADVSHWCISCRLAISSWQPLYLIIRVDLESKSEYSVTVAGCCSVENRVYLLVACLRAVIGCRIVVFGERHDGLKFTNS